MRSRCWPASRRSRTSSRTRAPTARASKRFSTISLPAAVVADANAVPVRAHRRPRPPHDCPHTDRAASPPRPSPPRSRATSRGWPSNAAPQRTQSLHRQRGGTLLVLVVPSPSRGALVRRRPRSRRTPTERRRLCRRVDHRQREFADPLFIPAHSEAVHARPENREAAEASDHLDVGTPPPGRLPAEEARQ